MCLGADFPSPIFHDNEAVYETSVANVDQSEQPIYGHLSNAEECGVEPDVHHLDMGYREDDELY